MTGERYSYISSHIAKEIARFGGKVDDLVPSLVRDRMFRKLGKRKSSMEPRTAGKGAKIR